MGYKPPKTVYKLNFSQTAHAGLEVSMRATTLQKLLELQDLSDTDPTPAEARRMFADFSDLLVSWNVEDDDDQPVPATYDGVITQEPAFILMIITAYAENLTSAPPPLPRASGNGATSETPPTPAGLAEASRSLRS